MNDSSPEAAQVVAPDVETLVVDSLLAVVAEHDETVCLVGARSGEPCRCKCGYLLPQCRPLVRKNHQREKVADWLADHDARLRESIAADIEALVATDFRGNTRVSLTEAARIARGQANG